MAKEKNLGLGRVSKLAIVKFFLTTTHAVDFKYLSLYKSFSLEIWHRYY